MQLFYYYYQMIDMKYIYVHYNIIVYFQCLTRTLS